MKNEKGFTLLEMLTSLSLVLIMAFLFTPILNVLSNKHASEGLNKFEWEVFLQQADIEIKEMSELTIGSKGDILYLKGRNGQIVSYEFYQDKIRRRVNGTGHEIILQRISNVQYDVANNGVKIMVEDINGETYMSRLSSIAEISVNQQ
jgi:competence protein ComGF